MDELPVPGAPPASPAPPEAAPGFADRLAAIFGLPVPSPAPDILEAARRFQARPAAPVQVRAVLGLPAGATFDELLAAIAVASATMAAPQPGAGRADMQEGERR